MRTECTIPTYALTKSNIEIVICRARKTKDMPRISSQLTWLNLFGRLLQNLLFTSTILYFIFYCRLLSDTVCCCPHKILSCSQYSPYCVAECPCRRFSLFSAIAVCATPSANALVGAWHHFGWSYYWTVRARELRPVRLLLSSSDGRGYWGKRPDKCAWHPSRVATSLKISHYTHTYVLV